MKYLVIEVHPGYAVLLDSEGRFLRAANLGYQVGETVTEIVVMKEHSRESFIRNRKLIGVYLDDAASASEWRKE